MQKVNAGFGSGIEPNPAVHSEGYSVESTLFSSWWGSSRCHPTTLWWPKLKERGIELAISSVSWTRVDCTDPASTWHLWPITAVEIKVCIHPSGLAFMQWGGDQLRRGCALIRNNHPGSFTQQRNQQAPCQWSSVMMWPTWLAPDWSALLCLLTYPNDGLSCWAMLSSFNLIIHFPFNGWL